MGAKPRQHAGIRQEADARAMGDLERMSVLQDRSPLHTLAHQRTRETPDRFRVTSADRVLSQIFEDARDAPGPVRHQ